MSKWSKIRNQLSKKKESTTKRSSKEIEQEYTNVAAKIGDEHFKQELIRANIQQLTLRMSQLKDEHALAKSQELKDHAPSPPPPEPVVEAAP